MKLRGYNKESGRQTNKEKREAIKISASSNLSLIDLFSYPI